MKKLMAAALGTTLASLALAGAAGAHTTGGVAMGVGPASTPAPGQLASPTVIGDTNFDNLSSPCLFVQTTRLVSLDALKFKGATGTNNGGAVLNQCGGFGVSGFSAPNFLAFNDGARMADGSVPSLPEKITFPGNYNVSLAVGSAASAGRILKLQAKSSTGLSQTRLVALTPGLQRVGFSIPVHVLNLKSAQASLPVDIMVVDDILWS
jgi:hypothetical protein